MNTQPKQNENGKRPLNDESTTAVNHSQLNDDNKENQPANHQSTKPGIAGMICTCKHVFFCELKFLFQLQRKEKETLPNMYFLCS